MLAPRAERRPHVRNRVDADRRRAAPSRPARTSAPPATCRASPPAVAIVVRSASNAAISETPPRRAHERRADPHLALVLHRIAVHGEIRRDHVLRRNPRRTDPTFISAPRSRSPRVWSALHQLRRRRHDQVFAERLTGRHAKLVKTNDGAAPDADPGAAVRRDETSRRDGADPHAVVAEAQRRHHQRHAEGALIVWRPARCGARRLPLK